MKNWLRPDGYERRYKRFLKNQINQLHRELITKLKLIFKTKIRIDSDEEITLEQATDELETAIAGLLLWWLSKRQETITFIGIIFNSINAFNDEQFRLVVRNLTGYTLPPSYSMGYAQALTVNPSNELLTRFGELADVYRQEPYLVGIQSLWESSQISYFDNLIRQTITETELIAKTSLLNQTTYPLLQSIIEGKFNSVIKKADSFIVQQSSNLDNILAGKRQQSIGGKSYMWDTRKDERVRGNPSGLYPNAKPSHYHRQGLIFYWNTPPEGGHPGQAPGCRCRAIINLI